VQGTLFNFTKEYHPVTDKKMPLFLINNPPFSYSIIAKRRNDAASVNLILFNFDATANGLGEIYRYFLP
jgi:hypothetical protein